MGGEKFGKSSTVGAQGTLRPPGSNPCEPMDQYEYPKAQCDNSYLRSYELNNDDLVVVVSAISAMQRDTSLIPAISNVMNAWSIHVGCNMRLYHLLHP